MSNVDSKEIEHFAKDSSRWWDEDGPFLPLHRLGPARMKYICSQIKKELGADSESAPFSQLGILDIGCGGGLTSEPLARLGARVTGIDADSNAVSVAKEHAKAQNLDINYIDGTAEMLADQGEKFDVVLALEIVEHIPDVEAFVKTATELCKDGGIIIFSTLNRTAKSFALGIIAAEYILGWVPKRTHNWKKFLRPSELARMFENNGATPISVTGVKLNPLSGEFELSSTDLSVNYFITCRKQ
jgi:2-polyprenyl-6-hydroxyphenyl methylase/3-demethylubiquinone-9 3-methyltransferase